MPIHGSHHPGSRRDRKQPAGVLALAPLAAIPLAHFVTPLFVEKTRNGQITLEFIIAALVVAGAGAAIIYGLILLLKRFLN